MSRGADRDAARPEPLKTASAGRGWDRHPGDRIVARRGFASVAAVIFAVAVGVVWAPSAAAQGRDPGVDQYVPCVPGAGGDGDGCKRQGSGSDSNSLPDEVRKALPGTEEGRALGQIATNERLGAPSNRKRKRDSDSSDSSISGSDKGGGGSGGSGSDDGGGATGAVSSAVTDWDDPVVPIVAGLMLLLTAAAAFVGVRRRRRTSGP
jgi:hypothetical protein